MGYTFADLEPGTMTLPVGTSGYEELRRTVTVLNDTTLDVGLEPRCLAGVRAVGSHHRTVGRADRGRRNRGAQRRPRATAVMREMLVRPAAIASRLCRRGITS